MSQEGGKLSAIPADTRDHAGTLAVPCTVGLIAGAKHDAEAKQLIDYLLSKEVEDRLIAAHFAARSVRRAQETSKPPLSLMPVDYNEVARTLPRAVDAA